MQNIQADAANVILGLSGPSDRFTLRYGWLRFYLKIKPLTTKQLIEISRELSKVKEIDRNKTSFSALMDGIEDTWYIARSIAIATGTKHRRIVTKAIMKLDLKDVQTLFKLVHKHSDPSPYFFFTILAKGRMNLLINQKQDEQ
jgi:hypothetical protein